MGAGRVLHLPSPGPTAECLCGHPIRHLFVVRHDAGHAVSVGSDCVRRFENPEPGADPFATLMAVAAKPDAARIGVEVGEMLHDLGWLNDFGLRFCRNVARYRTLYNGQRARQNEINRDVRRRARADAETALEDAQ